ncbi:Dipeptide-binding ABC transporter, periplasmic substrate-binding component [Enhygromyxa salina]|uniref:Dipeptide-binding ABC transporter, periplasmic substrate-binding component n=1 Tax=Enhygromyxa salina TaxID=215803 RepID=A0A0C2D1Z5_9BACT|nr:IgGFc-binding protein [Enhygromyxa salina]KIG15825.1 Dipeptide-binding ABC transporter, periplasmic substrate-binding component [Enhygromyxa salina]
MDGDSSTSVSTSASTNSTIATSEDESTTAATDETADTSTESGLKFDVNVTDMGLGELGCSQDLRAVINGSGELVEECAPDEGCDNGECVPACQAAASSQANFGCHFIVPTPPSWAGSPPPCFATFLTNSWDHSVQLQVARDGVDLDVSVFARVVTPGLAPEDWPGLPQEGLPPDSVAVLFLSHQPNAVHPQQMTPLYCPSPTAVEASTELVASGRSAAFEITTDIPVTAYDMMPFGGAYSYIPSAELVYPTSVWGTNYVAITPPPGTHNPPGPLWLQIVALEDDTMVEVAPTAQLLAGNGLIGIPQGDSGQVTLAAGEFVQWEVPQDDSDPSGTRVLSNKPIALHTGSRFLRLQPTPNPGGESAHQQNTSVATLGNLYVAAPYETRRADLQPEDIAYRFVGAVDGTTLEFDPPLVGAPATLELGEIVDFTTTERFRVTSQDDQHPFSMAQLMGTANLVGGTRPGATAPGFAMLLGDEEFVLMLPPAQFLQRYVFFTDPAYSTTNLVLTRVATDKGFADVTVDCLGVIGDWQSVGQDGAFEVTTVDLVRADVGVNGCENGLHTATSEGPFGLTVWGLDSFSSYGYPAGGNSISLNDVVVPAG